MDQVWVAQLEPFRGAPELAAVMADHPDVAQSQLERMVDAAVLDIAGHRSPLDGAPHPARRNALTMRLLQNPPHALELGPLDRVLRIENVGMLAPLGDDDRDRILPQPIIDSLDVPGAQTFVLLDGAKIDALPERLATLELPFMPLFQGDSVDAYGAAGPWIVRLDPTNRFFRQLFVDDAEGAGQWAFFSRAPAVILQTRMTLEGLVSHLRRFLRVRQDDDTWLFFRFYDPIVLSDYLMGISNWEMRARHIFETHDGKRIEKIITPRCDAPTMAFSLDPARLSNPAPTRNAFQLTARDRVPLTHSAEAQTIARMTADLRRLFARELEGRDAHDVTQVVQRSVFRFKAAGVRKSGNLLKCAAWDVIHGLEFERRDSSHGLHQMIFSPQPEAFKMQQISAYLSKYGKHFL